MENFIVVYPQGITGDYKAWNESETSGVDDVGFVSLLLDILFSQYNIDETRVYATGFSSGAGMAYRLAHELSNRISAIAPVAGCITYSTDPEEAIPVIQFKAKNDNYESVFPVLNYWIQKNQCQTTPDTFFSRTGVDGLIWTSFTSNANVVLYATTGGGHSWPTNSNNVISATDIMWEFFEDVCEETSDLDEIEKLPTNFRLEQNYPNPFNPATVISYSIPGSTNLRVNITVYDILGTKIKTLVNENKIPGKYEVKFNAKDLTSGIYIYTLTSGSFCTTKKMILVK